MKMTLLTWLAGASLLAASEPKADPRIRHELLDTQRVVDVPVGQRHATVLNFPGVVQGVIGYGLTGGKDPGTFQFDAPEGGTVVTVRNVIQEKDCYMSVMVDRALYVFHLLPSEDPVIALHMLKEDKSKKPLPELPATEVAGRRLDYSDTKLVQILRKARDRALWEKSQPQWYETAELKTVALRNEQASLTSHIEEVHRFPEDDAIVLLGKVENSSSGPLQVVPLETSVRVGERVLSGQLVDFSGVVPSKSSTPFAIVLTGDSSGSRLNLSVGNDFRVILGSSKPFRAETAGVLPPKGGSK